MPFTKAKAQWVTIPDTNFVNWLNNNGYAGCMNGSLMDTTCITIVSETRVDCIGSNIKDFNGLQYFDSLDTLNCFGNNLSQSAFPVLHAPLRWLNCSYNFLISLPILPPTITHLNCSDNLILTTVAAPLPDSLTNFNCSGNDLMSLPPLPSGLSNLGCSENLLTSLPNLPGNLQYIHTNKNQLTSLPPLPSSLVNLYCSDNLLGTLPTLPNTLEILHCENNQLTALPALTPNLKNLHCENNLITSIPMLPVNLRNFDCSNNQLSTLPALNDSLRGLGCANNFLSTLPTLPDSLQFLYCYNNQLTILPPLPYNLTHLYCQHNLLTQLPALPNPLTISWINCSNNLLTSLPTLTPSIHSFFCDSNQITSLPTLPNTLDYLSCSSNQLTNLPTLPPLLSMLLCENNQISCFPIFPNSLGYPLSFDIVPNPFSCLPNYTPQMDSAMLAIPLCQDNDVINNPNACPAIKGIIGYTYQDLNSNCAMGSADGLIYNIPVQLFDSAGALIKTFYTLNNGAYNYILDSGAYTVVIDTLGKPYTVNCISPGVDSTFTLTTANPLAGSVNFEIACKSGFDVGAQSIHSTGIIFPGMPHQVHVAAGNVSLWNNLNCASGIGGIVVISVTGPVAYDSISSNALIPSNISNNVFTYNIADFGTLDLNAFSIWFTTNITAQSGNWICVSVDVIPSVPDNDSTNNQLSFCYNVLNSFDPNDKQVYPDTVPPLYNDWFTYTIRFQNTGTAPAQNIRIVDTLDSNLDLSTFEIINYSHANTTTLTGNIATFRFPAIQLPDSSTNEEASHGFIQYRIKPLSNLALGTQINNTAHIYFDFNSPIATNNAQSNFTNTVSAINLKPQISNITLYPNPVTNGILKINFRSPQNQPVQLTLFDLTGRKVFSSKINSTLSAQTIALPKLANGVYTCELTAKGLKASKKLVILSK